MSNQIVIEFTHHNRKQINNYNIHFTINNISQKSNSWSNNKATHYSFFLCSLKSSFHIRYLFTMYYRLITGVITAGENLFNVLVALHLK